MKIKSGFSIVELMIALTLGLILIIAVLGVYLAQKNTYRTNSSQAQIQSSVSAIAALVAPIIRSAGFCGCSTLTAAVSNLNAGGSPPISTLSTTPTMIMGYNATQNTITNTNAPNSTSAASWSPSLDASLLGLAEATSDVVVVLGGNTNFAPIGVTQFTSGSATFDVQNTTNVISGQFAAISDCLKASVFLITGVAGNTISHVAGTGPLSNISSSLTVGYPSGSQFLPLSQTAFFVGHDPSGQSTLFKATLNSNGTWTASAIAPGVNTLKVAYGVGTTGIPSQYVPANAVTDWSQVNSVRLAFLLEGQKGSQTISQTQYTVGGQTVNVPLDNKIRHVYEMTINLRNSST